VARHHEDMPELGHDIVGIVLVLVAAAIFAAMAWAGRAQH
jgi:hypothetical protein